MILAHPEFLALALLALPELLFAALRAARLRSSLLSLAGPSRRDRAGTVFSALSFVGSVAATLFIVSVACALAGPSWGRRGVATEKSGLEAAFVLDVSNSMEARDGSPTRLEAAKAMIRAATRGVAGGTVSFALVAMKGQGILLLPMTEDLEALDGALDYANPDVMTARGTNLERGIISGLDAFTQTGGSNRVLIAFSDGGETSGAFRKAAEETRKRGARLVVVGVGGTEALSLPGPDGSSLLGSSGRPVLSALEPGRLRSLAALAGGRYLGASDPASPAALAAELRQAKQGGMRVEYQAVDRSGLFAALALLFLVAVILAETLSLTGARR